MSCQGNFLSNAACAAKSGVSGMASRSAAAAGNVGQAYAGQMKKNVETAKNVGGKVAGAYAGQVKRNVGAYKGAGQAVAGAAKGVGQAYVGQTKKNVETAKNVGGKVAGVTNGAGQAVAGAAKGASQAYVGQTQKNASAIAGAARSVGDFYMKQARRNIRASAAVPGAVKSFLGGARRAAQAHNETTNEPKQKAIAAFDAYKRGVMNTKLRAGGKVATAAVGAVAYTALGGAEGERAIGTMNGVSWALTAATVAKERAYLKTPEGQAAKDTWDGHVKEYSAARKTANANYAKAIFGEARQLAGKLKAARMEA